MRGRTKGTTAVFAGLLALALTTANIPSAFAGVDDTVTFTDDHLKQALVDIADGNGDGELTEGEMAALTGAADLSGQSISSLGGLAYATGITGLDLSGNSISDISELSAMTGLAALDLSDNMIDDVSALSSLTGLQSLNLNGNELSDIGALYDVDNPPVVFNMLALDVLYNCLDTASGSDDMEVIDAMQDRGCNVVYDPQNATPVSGVTLNISGADMCPGDTVTLSATVLPEDAGSTAVTWQSSTPSVATVSGGNVTAVAAGTATITVTTADGSYTGTCTVSVAEAALSLSDASEYEPGSGTVRNVMALTTVQQFKENFSNDADTLFVYDKYGNAVTSGFVATGMTVKLVVSGTVRDSRTIIVEGDTSGDGVLAIKDYTLLKLHLLGQKSLSGVYVSAGDYNRDNSLTVADYVRMRLTILGMNDAGGYLPNLPTVSDPRIRRFLDIALEQLGKPYVWGAEGPDSFDCSGFVYYCLNKAGYIVGRSSANTYSKNENWEYVDKDDLQPGDLMFYYSDSDPTRIGHIGIYLGNGFHIHASSDYGCIIICGVEGWYERMLSHGRRVFY